MTTATAKDREDMSDVIFVLNSIPKSMRPHESSKPPSTGWVFLTQHEASAANMASQLEPIWRDALASESFDPWCIVQAFVSLEFRGVPWTYEDALRPSGPWLRKFAKRIRVGGGLTRLFAMQFLRTDLDFKSTSRMLGRLYSSLARFEALFYLIDATGEVFDARSLASGRFGERFADLVDELKSVADVRGGVDGVEDALKAAVQAVTSAVSKFPAQTDRCEWLSEPPDIAGYFRSVHRASILDGMAKQSFRFPSGVRVEGASPTELVESWRQLYPFLDFWLAEEIARGRPLTRQSRAAHEDLYDTGLDLIRGIEKLVLNAFEARSLPVPHDAVVLTEVPPFDRCRVIELPHYWVVFLWLTRDGRVLPVLLQGNAKSFEKDYTTGMDAAIRYLSAILLQACWYLERRSVDRPTRHFVASEGGKSEPASDRPLITTLPRVWYSKENFKNVVEKIDKAVAQEEEDGARLRRATRAHLMKLARGQANSDAARLARRIWVRSYRQGIRSAAKARGR